MPPDGASHAPSPQSAGLDRDALTWLAYLFLGDFGFVLNGLGPALPSLRIDLGLSYAVVGLHSALFAVGLVICGLIGDRAIQRFGRRASSWGAATGMALGTVLMVSGRSLPETLAGAFVAGTCGSLLVVLVPAILSDRHGSRRSAAIAEANAVSSALGAAAPLVIGAATLIGLGWRIGLVAGPVVVLGLLALRYRRVSFARAGADGSYGAGGFGGAGVSGGAGGSNSRRVRQSSTLGPGYWRSWLTVVLVVSVEFCMVFWATDYLGSVIRLDAGIAASATTVFLIGMVLGRIAGGRLALRVEGPTLLRVALLVAAAGFACFWLTNLPAMAVCGLFVTGLGVALLYPIALGLTLATSVGATDRAAARATLGSGLATSGAPLLLAGLADQVGLRVAYLIVPALLSAAWLNLVAGRRAAQSSTALIEPGVAGRPTRS